MRRFFGDSMPMVLEFVRREVGENALILRSRENRGWLSRLFRRPRFEVWVADDASSTKCTDELCDEKQFANSCGIADVNNALAEIIRRLDLLTAGLFDGASNRALGKMHCLWERGIDLEVAKQLVERCNDSSSIFASLKFTGGLPSSGIIALVGPTGVGKTTTIAKLAANAMIQGGAKVAFVTLDVYRVGAIHQLRSYAELMGLRMAVAGTPKEAKSAVESLSQDVDIVFIDTVGRSPKSRERLNELAESLNMASPSEIHLVLSANMSLNDMLHAAEAFSIVKPTCLLFTKLDEAELPGVLVSAAWRLGLPVSFLTIGQSVPEDIEVANPRSLARWVFGGESGDA